MTRKTDLNAVIDRLKPAQVRAYLTRSERWELRHTRAIDGEHGFEVWVNTANDRVAAIHLPLTEQSADKFADYRLRLSETIQFIADDEDRWPMQVAASLLLGVPIQQSYALGKLDITPEAAAAAATAVFDSAQLAVLRATLHDGEDWHLVQIFEPGETVPEFAVRATINGQEAGEIVSGALFDDEALLIAAAPKLLRTLAARDAELAHLHEVIKTHGRIFAALHGEATEGKPGE